MDLPVNYDESSTETRRLVREEYARRQNGLCSHCGAKLDGLPAEEVRRLNVRRSLFPPNFFKWPVHLHHDHKTGMTIGAVHNHCNAVLWEHHGQ